MRLPMIPNGYIIYDGPSLINGQPITVVVTGINRLSDNVKTGSVIQTYILPEQVPHKAIFNGNDESVCGDCIHRYKGGAGSCYVNPITGPRAVWEAEYPVLSPQRVANIIAGRTVRLGAYGDPSAAPISIWDDLLSQTTRWTGYTHQWKRAFAKDLKKYCMASCETPHQAEVARKMGWRTFRIRYDSSDELMPHEFACPASEEQGKRLTCDQCRACDGGSPSKASPAIIVHGPSWKAGRLKEVMRLMRLKKKFRGIFDDQNDTVPM